MPNPAKDVGGYFEGISEEEIKYDTFSAGKKLAVNVGGEVHSFIGFGQELKIHMSQNCYFLTLKYCRINVPSLRLK